MVFLCQTVKFLPLLLCIATPICIFITYGIAVGKDHVFPIWPYISDTGTKPPESCIFGLLLSIIAFSMCIIIYIRYRVVSEYVKLYQSVRITPFWNRVSALLGYSSAFGLHIVANFQELQEFLVHITGALLCFFSATMYFFLQTIFTREMHPEAKLKFWIRAAFTFLNALFIVGTFAPIRSALEGFEDEDKLKWTPESGGYDYHIVSTFSEWLLVFSFCGYICTIFWDFKKIEIEPIKITFISVEGGRRERNIEEIDGASGTATKNVAI